MVVGPWRHHGGMASDEVLAARVRDALAERTEFTEKAMFGGLASLVNTHMACGRWVTT